MRWRSFVLGAGFACAVAGALTDGAHADSQTVAAQLRDRALTDPRAYDLLESLTSELGPRPVGMPAMERARDWAIATLKSLGFHNVHAEEFAKTAWVRGEESAAIVSPAPQKLAVLGLGTSVPTPPEGIEAEIVVLKSMNELTAAPLHAFDGKIVVVNQPMARTQNGRGYGAAVPARSGASEAARRGAVAYLTRSISTGTNRSPHTGAQKYLDGVPKIPAGALGVPDADLLQALAARGPVRIRLKLLSSMVDGKAWNVSGEIPGSTAPKDVIVIGGHLDSWDPGTGAIDDGAGVVITTMAAAMINQVHHPRRTIRVVMFGSEEQNGSSDAYLAAHKDELPNIALAGECDLGADRVYAVQLPANATTLDAMKPLAAVLAPIAVMVSPEAALFPGSDVSQIVKAGVPAFAVNQDASRYFDYHHSADDTLAIVDKTQLNQNVAAWVATLYMLADSDIDYRHIPAPPAAPAP